MNEFIYERKLVKLKRTVGSHLEGMIDSVVVVVVVVARATDERGGVLIDKSKRFVEIDR